MAIKASYTVEEVKGALRKVRTKLLNGKITEKQFSMADFTNSCGTVRCIAGWAALELGVGRKSIGQAAARFEEADPDLDPLFYGTLRPDISPSRAAKAIQNYFDGKSPWSAA